MLAFRNIVDVLSNVSMLEPRADQRPEHTDAPKRDLAPLFIVHGARIIPGKTINGGIDILRRAVPRARGRSLDSHETNTSLEPMYERSDLPKPLSAQWFHLLIIRVDKLGPCATKANRFRNGSE